MTLPASLPFNLGQTFEFDYGATKGGSVTFPPESRTSGIPAETRSHTIEGEPRVG